MAGGAKASGGTLNASEYLLPGSAAPQSRAGGEAVRSPPHQDRLKLPEPITT
jgi:hypothetical protein